MSSIKKALLLFCLLWFVYLVDFKFGLGLSRFGILPRTKTGLIGIAASPFLHANLYHIVSNTVTLFFLSLTLWSFYPRIASRVIILSIIIGGSLVWVFARQSVHIGASGLIYSIAAFLVAMGLFHRSFRSLLIAIFIAFFYGGLIWGVFPSNPRISWEGHLFGGIAGIVLAYSYRTAIVR
jgi:membrane associated rhomboid family serine protease